MNAARSCALIAGFAGLALALVAIRAEQTRCAAETLKLESRWIELRRQRWAMQTRVARLRSPRHLHDRIALIQSTLQPPSEQPEYAPVVRLALSR